MKKKEDDRGGRGDGGNIYLRGQSGGFDGHQRGLADMDSEAYLPKYGTYVLRRCKVSARRGLDLDAVDLGVDLARVGSTLKVTKRGRDQ